MKKWLRILLPFLLLGGTLAMSVPIAVSCSDTTDRGVKTTNVYIAEWAPFEGGNEFVYYAVPDKEPQIGEYKDWLPFSFTINHTQNGENLNPYISLKDFVKHLNDKKSGCKTCVECKETIFKKTFGESNYVFIEYNLV